MELWNGASSNPDVFISETVWSKAIDKHVKAYPEAWAI